MKNIKIGKSLIKNLFFFVFTFISALGVISIIGGNNIKVNAISCGGGSCPDGTTYGADANAGQPSCAARAQEACAPHQGGGNSGGNNNNSNNNSGGGGGGVHCDAGTCNDGYSFGSDDHFGGGSCSNRNTAACSSHGGIQSGGQGSGSGGTTGNNGGNSNTCDNGSTNVCKNTGFASCHNYSGPYNCECYPSSSGSNSCSCYQDIPPGQSSFACGSYVHQACSNNAGCDSSHVCTGGFCVPGNNTAPPVDTRPVCANIGSAPSSSQTDKCCGSLTPGAGGICANPPTASSISSTRTSSSSAITEGCSNSGDRPSDSPSGRCCSPLISRGGICALPPTGSLVCSAQGTCRDSGNTCCSPGVETPAAVIGISCTSGVYCSPEVTAATELPNGSLCINSSNCASSICNPITFRCDATPGSGTPTCNRTVISGQCSQQGLDFNSSSCSCIPKPTSSANCIAEGQNGDPSKTCCTISDIR